MAGAGVSIFVPALNEEKSLSFAVDNVLKAAEAANAGPIEIILVNDGSRDGTRGVVESLAQQHSVVRPFHYEHNMGWGVAFQRALQEARYPKLALYPGDGMVSVATLRDMIRSAYRADFVCAYTVNREARSGLRNRISNLYTIIYRATFRIPLRYVNATPVYPVERLRAIKLGCRRYSFPSEVNMKVIRAGASFMEIPGYHDPRNMTSSALKLKNLAEVIATYLRLIVEIYVTSRQTYAHTPVRVSLPESEEKTMGPQGRTS